MANPTELKMAFRASGNMELRTTLSQLVQDMTDTYILVERGPGQWGVLRAAELAWLPSCKTLEELEKYFIPSYILPIDGLTEEEVANEVLTRPKEIALLSRQGQIQKIVKAPGELGPGNPFGERGVALVICQNCGRRVAKGSGSTLCPQCAKALL